MDLRTVCFREFHRAFYGRVTRFVGSLGVRSGDVGDVVQDVFVTAWQRRADIAHEAAVCSWLFETARNHVLNYRRRRWNNSVDLSEGEEETIVSPPRRGVEAQRLRLMSLANVVAALGDREREAWLARYLDDGTLPEVAARCGCSLAEVKRRIQRAEMAVEGVLEETVP